MADGYDRFDNEGSGGGGGSFVLGLLTGTVLGAGLGMLFAPKAGSEIRQRLSEQAGNLKNQAGTLASQASEGVRKVTESAGEWTGRGREIYGKAVDAVTKGADEAQQYVRDTAVTMKEAVASAIPATESMRGSGSDQARGSQSGSDSSSTGPRTGPSSSGGPRRT